MDVQRFPELIASLYQIVAELEHMFPGRHFTPDGHLVGSIAEALAAYHYGLELLPASAQRHDGVCQGRNVQVKGTQGERIALSSMPDHLLVLKLREDGSFTEEYNGPGEPVWALVEDKPKPKNGQYAISLASLRRLAKTQDAMLSVKRRTAA